MKERPIIFNTEMVRAILDNRKHETRRIIKRRTFIEIDNGDEPGIFQDHPRFGEAMMKYGRNPYGFIGDRLWVRETFQLLDNPSPEYPMEFEFYEGKPIYAPENGYGTGNVMYRADSLDKYVPWRPSIHMPRWASRITLEITDIRVERLQDITEEQAIAEGIERMPNIGPFRAFGWKDYSGKTDGFFNPIDSFKSLWNSINAKRGYSWESNPWVWVVEFKVVES